MKGWSTDYISSKFSPDEIPSMKDKFAQLLAYHNRDSENAFMDPQMDIIFKSDISAKIYAKANWVFDQYVKERLEYYLNEGLSAILPSKEAVAKMYLDIAKNNNLSPRDRILALKEYSDLMNYTNSDDENNTATQNVILISDNGSQTTWEEKLKRQQANLQDKIDEKLSKH